MAPPFQRWKKTESVLCLFLFSNKQLKMYEEELIESHPSLCIPRVNNSIDISQIRRVFEKIRLGKIDRIDVIERRNASGEIYKRAFIHFKKWNPSEDAQNTRNRLLSGKDIKIVYDNPWFWKVSANKWTKRAAHPPPPPPPSVQN